MARKRKPKSAAEHLAVTPAKPSSAAVELAKKRWKKTTPGERSAFASSIAYARWADKPPVKCKRCGTDCPSIRAARAHCPK